MTNIQLKLKLTSPEREDTLGLHGSHGTVHNTRVGPVNGSLLEHLALVLDQKLDSLDRSGSCLGNSRGNAGQHKVLRKSQLLAAHDEVFCSLMVLKFKRHY